MDQTVRQQWDDALTSGEYIQGEGKLCMERFDNVTSFCCLGVLTDLYLKATGKSWTDVDSDGIMPYIAYETLPDDVAYWAGLDDTDPQVMEENGSTQVCLSRLNDDCMEFPQIAALIRESEIL